MELWSPYQGFPITYKKACNIIHILIFGSACFPHACIMYAGQGQMQWDKGGMEQWCVFLSLWRLTKTVPLKFYFNKINVRTENKMSKLLFLHQDTHLFYLLLLNFKLL